MRRLKLTRLGLNRPQAAGSFVGDRCPQKCFDADGTPGVIGVYSVRHSKDFAITTRYLACKVCGWKPDNKLIEGDSPPQDIS